MGHKTPDNQDFDSCMVYLECESSTGSADLCTAAGVIQSHGDDLL